MSNIVLSTTTNVDLARVANKMYIPLQAIKMRDEFKVPRKGFGMILNFESSKEDGSHWVAVYRPKTNNVLYYFDSYGGYPLQSVVDASRKGKFRLLHNHHQLQTLESTACGWWTLWFLHTMAYSSRPPYETFNRFLTELDPQTPAACERLLKEFWKSKMQQVNGN